MSMTKVEMYNALYTIFDTAGQVPQGYDIDWWTKEKHEEARKKWDWDSWEETLDKTIEYMLREYNEHTR